MGRAVKTFFPKTRLSELAARPGGIARDAAIESANKSIEVMRGDADAAISASIAELETVVRGAKGGNLVDADLHAILRFGDQIVTLAGTFGYDALDLVARSMCDLADGMLGVGIYHAAPVVVHVQSMRLLMPGGMILPPEVIEKIHSELAKVVVHYNFGTLALPGVAEDGEVSLPN